MSRQHIHAEVFSTSPEAVFALLLTPSAIRQWWQAARAIVLAEPGGYWAAAWGQDEDQPDYLTVARILEFEPPRRLVLGDYRYFAASGPMPFEANFVTSFETAAVEGGTELKVVQDGFPSGSEADEYYAACVRGWQETFTGIRNYLKRLETN